MAGDQVSLSNRNVLHLIFCLIGRRLPWLATIFWCKYFGIFWSSWLRNEHHRRLCVWVLLRLAG